MQNFLFLFAVSFLFVQTTKAETLIAESDERAVYNNPTCVYHKAYVIKGADQGCFAKQYGANAYVTLDATCENASGKLQHVTLEHFLHIAVFKSLTWDEKYKTWMAGTQPVAHCRINEEPTLYENVYYTVELQQPAKGMLTVKAKLFKREVPIN